MRGGSAEASFRFRSCVAAFVELPTEIARDVLPGDLQPVELYHGTSVLSAMAFDFHHTPFGDYRELVLGIAVAPRVEPGAPMPRSAFFPFVVTSTSPQARQVAASQLHLPYHQDDVEIHLAPSGGLMRVTLLAHGSPVVEMSVTDHEFSHVEHAYQAFMRDGNESWTADIVLQAEFSENEDERGSLVMHSHAITRALPVEDVEDTPFREQWMRNGAQTFQQIRRVKSPARQ